MRQPRYRNFVNTAPLHQVGERHEAHVRAVGQAHFNSLQLGAFFLQRGKPTYIWLCPPEPECGWCNQVEKRLRREEDILHRAIAAASLAGTPSPTQSPGCCSD